MPHSATSRSSELPPPRSGPRKRLESGVFDVSAIERAHSPPFAQQILEFLPALGRRARQLCGSRSEADDLLQDTVERALRFETSFRPGTNLKAWLHQVLFSVFMTRRRRAGRERRALEALRVDPCSWPRSERLVESSLLSPRVRQALSNLPPQFAATGRLVDVEHRSYKHAAEALGVPVGTVMSRLFRGRKLLAEQLKDVMHEAA